MARDDRWADEFRYYMKVILLQNVSNVGQKDDVKNVADGYARNFLIPRGIAKPATEEALKVLAQQKEKTERERVASERKYQELLEKLKSVVLQFKMKVAEGGTTFGSVSAADIQNALKKQGIAVKKDWIELEEPIKTTGEHSVKIKFSQELTGKVKVIASAE